MNLAEIENIILDIAGFISETNFSVNVKENENKIPNVAGLLKKTNYDANQSIFSDRVTSNKACVLI